MEMPFSLLPYDSLFYGGFFPLFFAPFRSLFDEELPGRMVFCTNLPCVGINVACLHVSLADIFKAQAWYPYWSGALC